MYMSIIGKPADQDLDQYPHVLLTSPQEWDLSILDNIHPNTHGYPSWARNPSACNQHDPRIHECRNFQGQVIQTLSLLSEEDITSVKKHVQQPTKLDYNTLKF